VADYKLKWFTRPQTITYPSTNWNKRRVTSLIETNALPLSQASTEVYSNLQPTGFPRTKRHYRKRANRKKTRWTKQCMNSVNASKALSVLISEPALAATVGASSHQLKPTGLLGCEWWDAGVVISLAWGVNDLHMVQLMPLPPDHLLLH